MKRVDRSYRPPVLMVLLFAALLAGGGIGRVFAAVASGVTVAPGTFVGAATEPTVISSNPSNRGRDVPTSTNGSENVVTGTRVTASFSQPMDPETLNSSAPGNLLTFTVRERNGYDVPGTVVMNRANTVATFTPTAPALAPNTSYTATVTTAARNAAGVAMSNPVEWTFATNFIAFVAQTPVPLGRAASFAILTQSGVTDVSPSAIHGDVGSSPITGAATLVTCAEVMTGTVYSVDATGPLPCVVKSPTILTKAVGDMAIAYNNAAIRKNPNLTNLGSGEIGGRILLPGLYKFTVPVSISKDVTLSGGMNAVWIFQISGTLTQANATRVILARGALPKNVFWQTAGVVTIGTTAHFEGVILAKTLIALKTGASANGRLLARTAVTLEQNAVTRP